MRKIITLAAIALLLSCSDEDNCDAEVKRLYEEFRVQIQMVLEDPVRSPANKNANIQRLEDERDLKIMKACS